MQKEEMWKTKKNLREQNERTQKPYPQYPSKIASITQHVHELIQRETKMSKGQRAKQIQKQGELEDNEGKMRKTGPTASLSIVISCNKSKNKPGSGDATA